MLEFETRGGYSNGESSLDSRIGNMFYGTEGYLELDEDRWKAFRKREKEPFAVSKSDSKKTDDPMLPPGGTEHYANFIDAIRAGNSAALHCDIQEGFYSSALPHLANISYRVGRQLHFNSEDEKFVNDAEADKLLTRIYRQPYSVPTNV
jgi:hypothetical protein